MKNPGYEDNRDSLFLITPISEHSKEISSRKRLASSPNWIGVFLIGLPSFL